MEELSRFRIQPELRLRDGRLINNFADAAAYVREHELRPGVDTRDEVLHSLERARTQSEREAAAEAFLSWLEGLELVAAPSFTAQEGARSPREGEQDTDAAGDARDLASDARGKVQRAIASQQNAAADFVANLAETTRRASHEFDSQMPRAGELIRTAARQIDNVSEALRTRDAAGLARDAQDFARREPAVFVCGAMLAGFAVARFLKSSSQRRA